MATATKKRTPSTALVFNPARKLNIATSNPRRKKRSRRRNPVAKTVSARSHRIRRNPTKKNPASSFSTLLMASLFAGAGVAGFDYMVDKFAPGASGYYKVAIKGGLAWLLQSQTGRSIPLLGKYSEEMALFFGISAAVDLINMLFIPQVKNLIGNYLPTDSTQQTQLVPTTGQTTNSGQTSAPLSGVRGVIRPSWKPGWQRQAA